MNGPDGVSRRALLGAAGATGLAGTAGCLDRLWAAVERDEPQQVSLSVTSLPADEDPAAIRLAVGLVDTLSAVGIDAQIEPQTEEQLLRTVLLNNDFDLFVARFEGHDDPDELRTMFHSRFAEEEGWQNPFGFADRELDPLLVEQHRQEGSTRRETVNSIQRGLVESQPMTVIARPDHLTVYGTEHADAVPEHGIVGIEDLLGFLTADPDRETAGVGVLTTHVTVNRNPLSVEFRSRDRILDLVYEPAARRIDGELIPWLASDWSWNGEDLRIELREGLRWHDDEPLTASDLAFTYEFLQDTSDGETEDPVPAPRYRGRTSLIEGTTVVDDGVVEVRIDDASREVAERILSVEVLPEAHWADRTELIQDALTGALVWENPEPIGSGPFAFVDAQPEESLTLERFDGHFLEDVPPEGRLDAFAGGPTVDRLEVAVQPNPGTAVGQVDAGALDVLGTSLSPSDAELVEDAENAELRVASTNEYYLLGFNTRRHPLGNHQFRRTVARLFDREHLVESVFEGFATPTQSPLDGTDFLAQDLAWTGRSRLGPFPGTDGEVDPESVRELFREVGFRYNDEDELLVQQ